jgi:hypothetical protein
LIDAENKAETALEAENKKASLEKYAPVVAAKSLFTTVKATAITTPSGLTYKIVKRTGIKPVDGSTFIFTMRVILKTEIYLTVAMKM